MKQFLVFHPFLFAIFPVLFLFAYNIDYVPAIDLLLPMLVVTAGTLTLFFSLRLITRNYTKSGIITSYFLVFFFSYARFRDLIVSLEPGQFIQEHVGHLLAPLWLLLFITGAFFIVKSRRNFLSFTKFLNIVAIALVAISLINISIYEIKTINLGQEKVNKEGNSLNLINSDNLPDIYYIILDGHPRASTLKEIYNYHDSEFTDYLTNKGFYIASRSRSNYAATRLSLASSLNMKYINYLSDTLGIESKDYTLVYEMIGNNEVTNFLKSKGYRFIWISAGIWEVPNMEKYADVYRKTIKRYGITISNFASTFIQSTALAPFATFINADARESVLYVFDALADIPNIKEPTFVLAHVLIRMNPPIFDRYGNQVELGEPEILGSNSVWRNKEAYIEQLIFENKKVEAVINEILSKSDTPPIILLQADHGPASTGQAGLPYSELTKTQLEERMNILNAYFLPKNSSRLLYESVTPVNSFRIVFNRYFDANYDLLKDESYFSNKVAPYKFTLVPLEDNAD